MLRKDHLAISALVFACGLQAQTPNIVGYEYWFDQNHEDRVSVQVTPAQIVDLSNAPFNTTGLALRQHVVHMRWQDLSAGQTRWSSVVSRSFHVTQPGPWEITALRYWWSSDAEPVLDTDMRYLVFETPQSSIDYNGLLELCGFPTGPQTLKFQLRDNHGQWSSVVTRSVTVQPAGVLGTPQVSASQQVFCPGDVITLTATPPAGSGFATPTSYEWTVPEGSGWEHEPSTTNAITLTIGNTSGIVQVASRNYCGSSSTALLSLAIPEVPQQPNEINGPALACVGSSLDYSTDLIEDITYEWAVIGTDWSGEGTGNQYGALAGTGDATITVVPFNTCGVEGPPQTLDVAVVQPPVAGTDGSLLTCSDAEALDLIAFLGGTPENGGSWSGPSPVIGSAYDPATMEPGNYTYTIAGTAPCADATAAVTVEENTAPVVVPIDTPGSGLVGETLTFSIEPIAGATYQWVLPVEWETMDAASAVVEVAVLGELGIYQVCVDVTLDPCAPTNSCFEVSVDGTVDQREIPRIGNGLTAYPNPSGGLFHVVSREPGQLRVYDALGQLVDGPYSITDLRPYPLRMEDHPDGLYFVRVVGDSGVMAEEVVLQR